MPLDSTLNPYRGCTDACHDLSKAARKHGTMVLTRAAGVEVFGGEAWGFTRDELWAEATLGG